MPNENSDSSFPLTQRDISHLTQTATRADSLIMSPAIKHASRVRDRLIELTGHAQDAVVQQLNEAKGRLFDVSNIARDYASKRPFACLGVALAVGFLVGLTRRSTHS